MSSPPIPKQLFEKVEYVSSHDPDVDQNNLIYIESDSEGSEKFNCNLHLQEATLQEVINSTGKDSNDKFIEDNPIHVTIKREEEFIIDDEPIQFEFDRSEDNSQDSWNTAEPDPNSLIDLQTAIGHETATEECSLSLQITRLEPPSEMNTPVDNENSSIAEDEEQFELIPNTPTGITDAKVNDDDAADTSLMDHQYSQQEETNKEFCYELVQGILKDSGNESNPSAILLLSKFTDLVECFVDEAANEGGNNPRNSQMSLLLTSMKTTLKGIKTTTKDKTPVLEPQKENKVDETALDIPLTQEESEKSIPEDPTLDSIEIPPTQSEEEPMNDIQANAVVKEEPASKIQLDIVMKEEPEGHEGVSEAREDDVKSQEEMAVQKFKADVAKVKEFSTKLNETACELLSLPMNSMEEIFGAKKKFLDLLSDSKKDYRSLVEEIQELNIAEQKEINEKSKKNLIAKLEVESSDYMSSDSDSDGQIINLKRKIPKSGPRTPAIVSSTKEDSDASETILKVERKIGSQTSDSELEKDSENEDYSKAIEKLLDFNTLNCPKPASSKSAGKQKKLRKKKKKRSSDINSIPSSSDDDDSLMISSTSGDSDRETSDEEQQMLLRQNADIRDGLLAGSDDYDSTSDFSNLSVMSSNDDDEKITSKSNKKKEAGEEAKASDQGGQNEPVGNDNLETGSPPPIDSPQPVESPQNTEHKQLPSFESKEVKPLIIEVDEEAPEQNEDKEIPAKKKRKLDADEREIFRKDFLEMNGSIKKETTSSSSTSPTKNLTRSTKTETNTEKSTKSEKSSDGTIDVSMFESRPAKNVDLQKYIERRAHASDVAGPSSTGAQPVPVKPITVMNDDEWISLSSDSDSEISATPAGSAARIPKRKKMLTEEELQEETKRANKEENKRVERLKKKNETLTQMLSMRNSQLSERPFSQGSEADQDLILDYNPKTQSTISVHPLLVKKLKEHQKEGIKFMYDTCYGSIADDDKTASGCILAHCMGLGKTLQLITLLHTLISYPELLETRKVIVICPKSTIMNWFEEFKKWLMGIDAKGLKVWYLEDQKFADRIEILKNWYEAKKPGVFLINYEAFRYMVHYSGSKRSKIQLPDTEVKKLQEIISKCLLKPGPDLVVCDEGHLIKNQTGATNKAITKIATKRRIILTGTPVQNNLNEYYAMVDWIKPALLGTVKEFNNLYANPIKDGQHIDSTPGMIKKMKQRSFILNRKLSKFVQRKEASVLKEFLPDKHEYCIFVPLTEVQERLYANFLKQNPLDGGHKLLHDYTALRKIWTHPKVLQNAYERAMKGELRIEEAKKGKNQVDEGENEDEDLLDAVEGKTGVKSNWWQHFASEDELESLLSSNKLILLFEILRMCEQRGEKVLVFSAFVAVLNVVEDFMRKISNQDSDLASHQRAERYGYCNFRTSWREGLDYFRLDGSSKREARHLMIQKFNDKTNTRMRCFLISARAGGQGINLIGANRCIILDTAWNPSADQQNIFRIYRLGQPKPCFVYRLIALGTMEEKIYSRSVTKQAMSGRVVDKLQIDRHYRMDELSELYVLSRTDYSKRPPPRIPVDEVLKHLLHNLPNQAYKYHDHESLLENKPEQDLNDEEINEAWQLYDQESNKSNLSRTSGPNGLIQNFPNDFLRADMANYNYLAAASGLTGNPLDQATGIYNQLYGSPPPSFFSNNYNLLPFDVSAAFRNALVPTSSVASPGVASSSSAASSLLRSQLNNKAPDYSLPPMFNNFVNPSTSTILPPNSTPQSRKRRLSNALTPATSTNIDNMISLQQRYNGTISRPTDNILDVLSTKNNSANLSILPDVNSPVIRRPPVNLIARRSPSLSKSNPTNVNVKGRSKSSTNALPPQIPSRKATPTSVPNIPSYSAEMLRAIPSATVSQPTKFSRQYPKEHYSPKPRLEQTPTLLSSASATDRLALNVPGKVSPMNMNPSQSARTTPSLLKTNDSIHRALLNSKKQASNHHKPSSGTASNISKISTPSAGNSISPYNNANRSFGTSSPVGNLVTNNIGSANPLSTPKSANRSFAPGSSSGNPMTTSNTNRSLGSNVSAENPLSTVKSANRSFAPGSSGGNPMTTSNNNRSLGSNVSAENPLTTMKSANKSFGLGSSSGNPMSTSNTNRTLGSNLNADNPFSTSKPANRSFSSSSNASNPVSNTNANRSFNSGANASNPNTNRSLGPTTTSNPNTSQIIAVKSSTQLQNNQAAQGPLPIQKAKPNLVARNRINSIQANPRTVMSTASQNTIPQKSANSRQVFNNVKLMPEKQQLMAPRKVVFKKAVVQSAGSDVNKFQKKHHVIHPNTSNQSISITKLNPQPGGSGMKARPMPVISSAVSLSPLASKTSSQPSTSSQGSRVVPQKRANEESPTVSTPKRQRVEATHLRIIPHKERQRMNQDTPSAIEDIVEIE